MSAPDTFREASSDDADEPTPPDGPDHSGPGVGLKYSEPLERRRSRRPYLVAAVVIVLVAGGGAGAYTLNHGKAKAPASSTQTVSTAPITRGDVVDTTQVDGKLTFGNQRDIQTTASGVVTWLPALGASVKRGQPLLKVDNEPVTLMYGSLPMYRTLEQGLKGRDVEQLEQNLKALGYGNGHVGTTFTYATTRAVKEWQKALKLTRSGTVDASQVVFETGVVRVSNLNSPLGGRIGGGKVMSVTDVAPSVHIDLDASLENLVKTGETVTVTMPNGNNVKGRITSIGSVATAGADNKSTVGVQVKLSVGEVGNVNQAPVSVQLESARAKNVLSVPVEALLALREGGFGVELVDSTGHHIVAVTTGTYGGGRVEISGDGLDAGMKVEVPSS